MDTLQHWFLDMLDGVVPALPERLGEVLELLSQVPVTPQERKYALILWLDRAGLELESWMVERIGIRD